MLNLPANIQPEKYINKILQKPIVDSNNEIVALAKSIIVPEDTHEYINSIIKGLGDSDEVGLYKIVEELSKHPEWVDYTQSVRQWLENEKRVFGF